jgi:hypothetical protein
MVEGSDLIIQNCGDELIGGKYIQPAAEVRSTHADSHEAINQLTGKILAYISRNESLNSC